jgi:hypothetical protein
MTFVRTALETHSINQEQTTHVNPKHYKEGKIENIKLTNLVTNYLPTY